MPENLQKKLSFKHLKKQAKQLLKAFRNGDYSTFQQFKQIKRYAKLTKDLFLKSSIKLLDAQYDCYSIRVSKLAAIILLLQTTQ